MLLFFMTKHFRFKKSQFSIILICLKKNYLSNLNNTVSRTKMNFFTSYFCKIQFESYIVKKLIFNTFSCYIRLNTYKLKIF